MSETIVACDLSSSTNRAKRLQILRQLTGLSRDKFQERYGIARGTLQNWETARFGGLTEKGAKATLVATTAEGVHCDLQWLLHGIGQEPHLVPSSGITHTSAIGPSILIDHGESQTIAEELLCFRKNNPDCIDLMVPDDTMLPIFRPGDYVAGNRRYMDNIDRISGFNCIVQTEQYGIIIRFVKRGDELGHFHLIATHPMSAMNYKPTLYNAKVVSAASIIWHRRPNTPVVIK